MFIVFNEGTNKEMIIDKYHILGFSLADDSNDFEKNDGFASIFFISIFLKNISPSTYTSNTLIASYENLEERDKDYTKAKNKLIYGEIYAENK